VEPQGLHVVQLLPETIMRPHIIVLCLISIMSGYAEDADKAKLDAPAAPLQLIVIPPTHDYKLDLGGLTAEQFGKKVADAVKKGEDLPEPPALDIQCELRNTGKEDIVVSIGGDATTLSLELTGPGALMTPTNYVHTEELRASMYVSLAPGEGTKIIIRKLAYGHRNDSNFAYWTKPGEYRLTVSYRTGVKPAPVGSEKFDGSGLVTITAAPVVVKVAEY
jgi:hypothetical protein